jgi:hypothetical protein
MSRPSIRSLKSRQRLKFQTRKIEGSQNQKHSREREVQQESTRIPGRIEEGGLQRFGQSLGTGDAHPHDERSRQPDPFVD